jgi:hypothetical protein
MKRKNKVEPEVEQRNGGESQRGNLDTETD